NIDQTCGFGPGGTFYGENQHLGFDAFYAIDLTRYDRLPPFGESASHRHVLAPTFGQVMTATRLQADADHNPPGNGVRFRHWRADYPIPDPGLFYDVGATPRTPPISSLCLHLAGTPMITVSDTMFVIQGVKFGEVDNTGGSAGAHLHFQINNRLASTLVPEAD